MNFLPYGGGGTSGWIGAFVGSAVVHVGLVAGLFSLQQQILSLAELQNDDAAFDIAVALDQLQTDVPLANPELEDPELPEIETLDPPPEDLPPEEITEDPPEPEEILPEEIDPEELPPEEPAEDPEPAEPEIPEEMQPEEAQPTETEVAEQAAPEETLEEMEAETLETAETETVEALPEAETVEALPEPETVEAGPVETASAAAPEPAETLSASPIGSDSPLDGGEPGALSPITPDNGGVQTVARVAPGAGGIDTGISVEPVSPVTGDGLAGTPAAVDRVESVTAVAPTPETPGLDTADPEVVTGTDPASAPAPAVAAQRPPTVQEVRLTDLIRRIRQVDPAADDACLAALPVRDGAAGVGIALIADDTAAMETFSQALVTPEDADVRQTRTVIDPAQCPAVSYIRNNVDYPSTRLGLRIDNDLVDSGGVVTGVVRGSPGRFVAILLVDDNGVVQDLARFTSTSGDFYRFEVPVTREGEPRDTKQMIIAAAFTEEPTELLARAGMEAQDVFSGLPDALAEGAELAVGTFDVR